MTQLAEECHTQWQSVAEYCLREDEHHWVRAQLELVLWWGRVFACEDVMIKKTVILTMDSEFNPSTIIAKDVGCCAIVGSRVTSGCDSADL